ncbi:hypothetical protein JL721_9267 [Aureococcus anophagefferens]|nr:hypothetical protein JL721_9267 [Aureococcus anophagefferens]
MRLLPVACAAAVAVAHVHEESLRAFRASARAPAAFEEVRCRIGSDDPGGARGDVTFVLRADWAPLACAAFAAASPRASTAARFFRVVPNFIAQVGFHPSWNGTTWPKVGRDERREDARNRRGTAAFAGSSKTQIFVNLADNKHLDREGGVLWPWRFSRDFGFTGYKEGTGQIKAYNRGVDALMREFPRMSHIERCRLVR